MQCPTCNKSDMRPSTVRETRKVGAYTYSAELDALRCRSCAESTVTAQELSAFDLAVGAELANHGPISGESFRFMRKAIPMPAVDLAKLLGTTPETISRWENGSRDVDRAAWFVVGGLVLDAVEGTATTRGRLAAATRGPGGNPAQIIELAPKRKPPTIARVLELIKYPPHYFDTHIAEIIGVNVEDLREHLKKLAKAGVLELVHTDRESGMKDWQPAMVGSLDDLLDAATAKGINVNAPITLAAKPLKKAAR